LIVTRQAAIVELTSSDAWATATVVATGVSKFMGVSTSALRGDSVYTLHAHYEGDPDIYEIELINLNPDTTGVSPVGTTSSASDPGTTSTTGAATTGVAATTTTTGAATTGVATTGAATTTTGFATTTGSVESSTTTGQTAPEPQSSTTGSDINLDASGSGSIVPQILLLAAFVSTFLL
jgi:cobalamin biosynthesis Mg chelatase CobN